jgi:hypothetical protein
MTAPRQFDVTRTQVMTISFVSGEKRGCLVFVSPLYQSAMGCVMGMDFMFTVGLRVMRMDRAKSQDAESRAHLTGGK